MESIDTNVVIRLLVRDDKDQAQRAETFFREAIVSGIWIAQIVIVECVWVLRSAYKFDKRTVVGVLRNFLNLEGIGVEHEGATLEALSAYETGSAGLADYLILESARSAHALPLWTFDEHLARSGGVRVIA